jgi:hypothetical protein
LEEPDSKSKFMRRMRASIDPDSMRDFLSETEGGYKHRVSATEWDQVLGDISRRGSVEPSGAAILSNGMGWPGGFASRMLCVLNEVAVAIYFKKSLAFCDNTFFHKVFAVYYNVQLPVFHDLDQGKSRYTNWGWDDSPKCNFEVKEFAKRKFSSGLMQIDFEYIASLKRFVAERLLQLNPAVKQQVFQKLHNAGFHSGTRYIGVHVRHGDKGPEMVDGLLPFSAYANAIRKEMNSSGLSIIYVASDDPMAKDGLRKELGTQVSIFQHYDVGSDKRAYDLEEVVMPFLVDLTALQYADTFIGTQSSNMGRMLYYLRSKTGTSISLDGDWSVIPDASSDAK